MTTEEAINIIERNILQNETLIEFNEEFDPDHDNTYLSTEKEALQISLQSIKEMEKYHSTDERLSSPYGENDVDMLKAYKEIGTVEECREAVEKRKPKKPKDSLKINPVIDGNGAYVDADMTVYLLCPNCGEMIGIDESCDKFCRECGQAIDENLEGMEDE